MKQKESISLKMILVGETQTGKTQIIKRFVHNQFNSFYEKTWIDFEIKHFVNTSGRYFKNHLWDLGGQGYDSRLSSIKKVDIISIVVDVSLPIEASNLLQWLLRVKRIAPDAPVCLWVNKIDLLENFTHQEKHKITQRLNLFLQKAGYDDQQIPIFYCSAKINTGIEQAFQTIAECFDEKNWKQAAKNEPQPLLPEALVLSPDEIIENKPLKVPLLGKPQLLQLLPVSEKQTSAQPLINESLLQKRLNSINRHKLYFGGNIILIISILVLLIITLSPLGGLLGIGVPISGVAISLLVGIGLFLLWTAGYVATQVDVKTRNTKEEAPQKVDKVTHAWTIADSKDKTAENSKIVTPMTVPVNQELDSNSVSIFSKLFHQ